MSPREHASFGWLAVAVLVAAAATAPAQVASEEAARHAAIKTLQDASAALDRQHQLLYGNDQRYLVRPGLLADRTQRVVTFRAYATGLTGNEPIEFFVIGPSSGKAYEAIAVSLALPSDIRAGLEFIGMSPGRGVNYLRHQFFPKGERVRMTFRWEVTGNDGTVSPVSARAEELLVFRGPDGRPTETTLPLTGLVFTGGVFLPGADGNPPRFHADVTDPGSIASNYNEPTTLLDLPVLARQSEVYRSRIINPAFAMAFATPLEIVLEPERGPGDPPRVVDVTLDVRGGPDLTTLTFSTTTSLPPATADTLAATVAEARDLAGVLRMLTALQQQQHEPFVTVVPGDEIPLRTIRQLYGLLAGLQGDAGLRLEPPPMNAPAEPSPPASAAAWHLVYEAFLPDERLRQPDERTWQPVELRLTAHGPAVLRDYTDRIPASRQEPRWTFTDTPVPDAQRLREMLAERVLQRRPLAVYAPENLTYGRLRAWLAPAVGADWVVWVFLEPAATP